LIAGRHIQVAVCDFAERREFGSAIKRRDADSELGSIATFQLLARWRIHSLCGGGA
jgi:hypothetical protein